jgi:hypothetical protein
MKGYIKILVSDDDYSIIIETIELTPHILDNLIRYLTVIKSQVDKK